MSLKTIISKICGRCKLVKNVSEFNKDSSSKDGLQYLCKTCSKELKKQHYTNNSDDYKARRTQRRHLIKKEIYTYKEKNPCKRCTLFFPYYMMDFDHLRDKKHEISDLVAGLRSLKLIWSEIEKTQLLCKNCHAIISFERTYSKFSKKQVRSARNYVEEIKKLEWCIDCKKLWPYYVLHFDHITNDKCFDISWGVYNKSIAAIKLEIKKCELVCSNCHAIRTQDRIGVGGF